MTRSEMAVHYGCTLKTLHSVLHRRGIRVSSIPLGEASKTPVSLRMDNDAEYGSAALLKALANYHVKHGNPEPYWTSLLGEAASHVEPHSIHRRGSDRQLRSRYSCCTGNPAHQLPRMGIVSHR